MTIHPTIAFRAEFLGKIQRGEKTQTRHPVRHSKLADRRRVIRPCSYRAGEIREVVSVDDRPHSWDALDPAERVRYIARGAVEGSTVYKQIQVQTDWFVRITAQRREAMIDISDADLSAEGFADDREGFLDFMGAMYGEHVETVWVIEFAVSLDVDQYPAKQAGYMHPEQYTRKLSESIMGDVPCVEPAVLASFAEHNRAKDTLRKLDMTATRLEDATSLEAQLAAVRILAREKGIDIRSTERLIQKKLNEIKRKLREAA